MAKFEALKFTKECAEQAFAKETSRKLSASVENFNDPTQRLTSLGPRTVCQDLIFAAARTVRERLCYEVQRTKSYSIGWVGKSKMATAIMLWHQLMSLSPGNTTTSIVLLSFEKGPPFYPQGRLQCKKRRLWQFWGTVLHGEAVDNYQLGIMHKQVGSLL